MKKKIAARNKKLAQCLSSVMFEPVEARLMMSTTTPTVNGVGTDIEYTGPYSTYMPVGAGPSAYSGYSSWGDVRVPVSSLAPNYTVQSTGGVASLTLSLYNTATSGTYAPASGTFGVYVVPNTGNIATSALRYGSGGNNSKSSTAIDLSAIASTSGDASSLGVSSNDLVGTFTINASTLSSGYTSFTFSSLSAGAQQAIAADINAYGQAGSASPTIELAVVPEDTSGHVDWEGNYTSGNPQVSMSLNELPIGGVSEQYNFGADASAVNVNSTAGQVDLDVTRSGYLSDQSTLNYSLSTGGTGSVTFTAGASQEEIVIPVSSSTASSSFTVTLTGATPTQSGDTASLGSSITSTVSVVGTGALTNNVSSVPATSVTDIETSGPYSQTYAPVNGSTSNGTGSFGYLSYEVLEFDPTSTPSVFPAAGQQVSSLSNLSLELYNSATTGNYGGHAGDFNVYFIPDNTTDSPTASMTFNSATTDGVDGQGGAISLGVFSFSNAATGYDTYTPSTLSTTVSNDIINDLNSGTGFRLVVAPGSANFAADFEGVYGSETPTLSLTDAVSTVSSPENVTFAQTAYAANEGSTLDVIVDRSGSNVSDTATVDWAINVDNSNAVEGTNYTGATSGTVTFAPGATSATIAIPTTAIGNQGGDKQLEIDLSNPTTSGPGTVPILGSGSFSVATISAIGTITDTTAGTRQDLGSYDSDESTIEHGGPYSTSYLNIAGDYSAGYTAYGAIDFDPSVQNGGVDPTTSQADSLTPSQTVTAINSITLLPTQGYPAEGTSGPLQVYLVSDTTSNIDPSSPQSANPHFFDYTADPNGFGSQFGTAELLGTVQWNASVAGDTQVSLPLTAFNSDAEATLIADLNSGTKFRIIVAPGNSGSGSVDASWEGNYTNDGVEENPQVLFNVTEGSVAPALPAWLASNSQATFDASTDTLTVTGPSTIISDPQATDGDVPNIIASGSAAVLTINPGSDVDVHIGGISLSNGASIVMTQIDTPTSSDLSVGEFVSSNHHNDHNTLVIGTLGAANDATISIDSSSTLNLEDNDLIIHTGTSDPGGYNELAAVQGLVQIGRDGGNWDGLGLTSSVAEAQDNSDGSESVQLAPVDNGDLSSPFSSYQVGSASEAVGSGDIIVKYTYTGDFNLDGQVNFSDSQILNGYYDNGASTGNEWAFGDTNGDGLLNFQDSQVFNGAFGNGTSGGTDTYLL